MADDYVPNGIESLKKTLYSPGAESSVSRSNLAPETIDPTITKWRDPITTTSTMPKANKKPSSFLKLAFVAALLFFVGSFGVASWQYFQGLNIISSTNIDLQISGPEKINAGDVLELSTIITNRNQKDLEAVKLSVTYPTGSRSADSAAIDLREIRDVVGTVISGQTITKAYKGVLYGDEKETKTINFLLEYRVVGSNAIFTKTASYQAVIGSSPVRITASLPGETNSGQEVTLDATIAGNAQAAVKNLAVAILYPPGFSFKRASPAPTNGNTVWSLGDLPAGVSKHISVTGVLDGQNDEAKSFTVNAGMLKDERDQNLNVTYSSLFKTISIKRSFVDLDVEVDGSHEDNPVIDNQKTARVDIHWTNTLTTDIRDGQMTVDLGGVIFDPASIVLRGGHYNSANNTITWTRNDAAGLGLIKPGETATVSFFFSTVSFLTPPGSGISRPTIGLTVGFTGTKVSGEDSRLPIKSNLSRTIKVNTVNQFTSRGLYRTGPFAQGGSLPPRVGQETLYTIQWAVTNSTSDLKEAKVTATVPTALRWVGALSPSGEKVTYNPADHSVTWDLGTLQAGAGTVGRREVAFQVGLTPSANQVGQVPILLSGASFTGIDTFTQKVLTTTARDITTNLDKDPLFRVGEAVVAQ